MSNRSKYAIAWISIIAVVIIAAVVVVIPAWLIQPFAPQTYKDIRISFLLRSWSPLLTMVAVLACVLLATYVWINSKRWFARILLFVPLALVLLFTWFARQNHFEWMFKPLAERSFARASEADFVSDNDMVLAVTINGDAAAYPVRQMAYHHVVQDVVGGSPITATY